MTVFTLVLKDEIIDKRCDYNAANIVEKVRPNEK